MNLPYPIHLTLTARVRLAALAAGYLLVGAIGLHHYLNRITVGTVLGLLAISVTWDGRPTRRSATIYAIAGLIFSVLYIHTAGRSLLFAAVTLCLFSLLHPLLGRPGPAPLICVLLMSPLFDYFSNVFSFPLRIGLTRLAGQMLSVMGTGFHAEGNTLVNGGTEFTVDPACMGLHMLTTSLITGMILIGVYQKKSRTRISILVIPGLLMILIALNALSNLFRIIVLVQFHIAADSASHSVAGMACFLFYVLLPAGWMTRRTVHWFGRPLGIQEQGLAAIGISTMTVLMHLGLLITLTIATYTGLDRSPNENLPLGTVHTPGYTTEMLHDRIVKLTNQQSLIYIKPISGFYSPDHQPAICWTGSGYQFKGVTEKILAGKLRYSARLEKNGEILYSAWWYDNGISTTTSQLDWRWDAFRYSRRYALVNVTAATPARLETEIRKFKNSNPCQQLLMN